MCSTYGLFLRIPLIIYTFGKKDRKLWYATIFLKLVLSSAWWHASIINLSSQEPGAGGLLMQDLAGQHNETMYQNLKHILIIVFRKFNCK